MAIGENDPFDRIIYSDIIKDQEDTLLLIRITGMRKMPNYEDAIVEEIKTYILSHLHEEITLKEIADAVCYSEEHTSRLFKKCTGENLFDYIRSRRLLKAAERIRIKGGKIIDIAFDSGFNSHEVFTRAFSCYFGISPTRFRLLKPEIKEFMPRGLKVYPLEHKESQMKNFMIYTRVVKKEKRKLIFYPAKKASHYFEYCEELGCDVWGKLLELRQSIDEPLGLWLPEKYRINGCSEYVQGIEVGIDYSDPLPEGMVCVELPETSYMIFQSQPYEEDDKRMMEVITAVQQGIETFNPESCGYVWAPEEAPRYQLIPLGERGYIEALPVRGIN